MGGSQDSDDQRPSTGKRTRRIVWRVMVLLLLGAIVNVWITILLGTHPHRVHDRNAFNAVPIDRLDDIWNKFGSGPQYKRQFKGWRQAFLTMTVTDLCNDYFSDAQGTDLGIVSFGGATTWVRIVDVGWPIRFLSKSETAVSFPLFVRPRTLSEHIHWLLTSEIRWHGFAINTIFYAVVLWLMWVAPGKVRRMVRVRRSQCPACGHIIADGTCANGLCSECGAPLPDGFKPKPEVSAKP